MANVGQQTSQVDINQKIASTDVNKKILANDPKITNRHRLKKPS